MKKAEIYYFTLTDEMPRIDKLEWFKNNPFQKIEFDKIIPDEKGNWINLTDNDFESLMPVCDKEVKANKSQKAIFKLFSLGVATNRDEWVYDYNKISLKNKVKLFIEIYNSELERWNNPKENQKINNFVDREIKWTSELESHLEKGNALTFDKDCIIESIYRPFIKSFFYFDKIIIHRVYQNESIFGFKNKYKNTLITVMGDSTGKPFFVLSINLLPDLNFVSPASGGTQCLPLYVYDKDGNRHDNITDWALNQFKTYYAARTGSPLRTASPENPPEITKLDIFHYVYAVLHNPHYREKYELNLKREFPRIPYYENFAQWAEWGKQLMELHLNYESIAQFPLERHDTEQAKIPKAKLKADKEKGLIILDDNTHLSGVPLQAWEYKLGNRSALEWILDQYKEKKPKDPTIAEKFNHYKFADYKEQVIELLSRVCTVSVETVKIVDLLRIESQQQTEQ